MANEIVEAGKSLTLSAGNSAGPVYVLGGGQLIVNGGTASEVAVQNMGNATVLGGGVMNTINASGGLVNVLSAGVANNTTLTGDAYMNILSSGTGKNVNIVDGLLSVSSGGYASGVRISAGGALKMMQGGRAAGISIYSGGTVGGFTQISGTASVAAMFGNAFAGTVTGLNATGNMSAVAGAVISGGSFASGTFQLMGGSATGLVILESGVLRASSADVSITNTHVTYGGSLILNGAATASNITIYPYGTVNNFTHVGPTSAYIGAIKGNTITGNGSNIVFEGIMNVGKDVTMTNLTVKDGVLFLSAGATAKKLTVSAGSAVIQSNAYGSGITLYDGTYLRIMRGGSAANIALAKGAKMLDFQQAGTSVAAIEFAYNNGIGGVIHNLNATGNVNILSGASVTSLTVATDGKITLNAGVKANTVSIATAGTLTIQNDATAQNITVATGGRLNISAGGSATAVNLTKSSYLDMVLGGGDTKTYITGQNEKGSFSYINGVASNFIVYAGQHLVVSSGGSARNLTIEQGGVLSAAMGADVSGYSSDMKMSFSILGSAISGLTNLSNFELNIGHGYAVDGQKLYYGGVQSIGSGGFANRTTIAAGGEVRVGYNGSAWDLSQENGGKISLDVYHAGALTSVTGSRYDSNGKKQEFTLESGTASNFIISSGAYMNIHSGGSAEETTVVAGGKLVLSSGGTATQVTLEENAILSASVFGKDSKTVLSASYGSVNMSMKNGVALGFVLENSGCLNVYNGGIASGVAIRDKGSLYVDYMGSAALLNIADGGNVYVANEGRVSDIQILDGGQLTLSTGAILAGSITVDGLLTLEGTVSFLGETITIDLTDSKNGDAPMIENISFISDAVYAINVNAGATGDYIIASGALNFSDDVLLFDSNSVYLGTIKNNKLTVGTTTYTLNEKENGDLVLSVNSASNPGSGTTTYTVGSFNGFSGVFELTGAGSGIIHSASGSYTIAGTINTSDWSLLGTGDFDGDGIEESLVSDGTNLYAASEDLWLGNLSATEEIVSITDYNNDGMDDLLIHNTATDQMTAWLIKDGSTYSTIAIA